MTAQQDDKDIQVIKKILESGDIDNHKNVINDYVLKGGVVYKITAHGLRWMAPRATRFQILRMAHDDIGHFGITKTFELVSLINIGLNICVGLLKSMFRIA